MNLTTNRTPKSVNQYSNKKIIRLLLLLMNFPLLLPAQYRINELAYDCNVGGDPNEVVEVRIENTFTGNVSDLTITLYNGNGGITYGTAETLNDFAVGMNDGTYTYYSWAPTTIMNGSPDGLSLDYQGTLVDFLSYEGTFTAVEGPANGMTSTDIGARQTNSSTCNMTLQINNSGTWVEKLATVGAGNTCTAGVSIGPTNCVAKTTGLDTYNATFDVLIGSETSLNVTASSGTPDVTTISTDGRITVAGVIEGTNVTLMLSNTDCTLTATAIAPICLPTPTVDARINEIGYDCEESGDPNEVIEVRLENAFVGNLSDFTVTLFNGNGNASYNMETLDNFVIESDDGTYTYYTWKPSSIMNGSPDGLSLDFQGALIEFLSYEGTLLSVERPVTGFTSTDIGVSQTNSSTCDMTLQLDNTGNWIEKIATSGSPNGPTVIPVSTKITAIGTCAGITAANENTYNITISGLIKTSNYHFDLDGDGINEVTNFTGDTIFITAVSESTNIPYINGTFTRLVQVDLNANGSYDAMIEVHEVLCTDADDDGDLDFGTGCDTDLSSDDKGYIVAAISPYVGTNVYVYVLTSPNDNAIAANNSGLFTELPNGNNGTATDYNVVALNFSNAADALAYQSGLVFSSTTGTIVTTSTTPAACSMACGSMAYDIECEIKKPIPTMSEWGLLIFGLLMLNLGLIFIRKLEESR